MLTDSQRKALQDLVLINQAQREISAHYECADSPCDERRCLDMVGELAMMADGAYETVLKEFGI